MARSCVTGERASTTFCGQPDTHVGGRESLGAFGVDVQQGQHVILTGCTHCDHLADWTCQPRRLMSSAVTSPAERHRLVPRPHPLAARGQCVLNFPRVACRPIPGELISSSTPAGGRDRQALDIDQRANQLQPTSAGLTRPWRRLLRVRPRSQAGRRSRHTPRPRPPNLHPPRHPVDASPTESRSSPERPRESVPRPHGHSLPRVRR